MKKTLIALLLTALLVLPCAAGAVAPEITAPSAILMEASTGKVLYEKNADERLPPASVTKVMTILLIAEAIDDERIALTDMVQTSELAASMGGSQIYLAPGETMSVQDLLKAVVMASGNDASAALAEHISGSVEGFVAAMNEKAAALGMVGTTFTNVHGLDADGHLTTARDIALMSRELLKHEWITAYTSTWMDSLRGGEFTLANTNKLLKSYTGTTGLKTGSTSKAKYCLSATATRNGMDLISVVLAAPTTKDRFVSAAQLLDFGFANYKLETLVCPELENIPVRGGLADTVAVKAEPAQATVVLEKGDTREPQIKVVAQERLTAPVEAGQTVGEVYYMMGETEIARGKLTAAAAVARRGLGAQFKYFLRELLLG
ncbi:MAG TPA: D-alanyl-D-alanine carboxypeptidase family protein [Candidatus Acidoferrum sp.]|nr:D-alanyl-D-alanine carboxypeptidase family protein [Candidatus Acidoferrum sp.]